MPWQPLVFDKSASFDFAKDLDGDDEEDVAASYTFDDPVIAALGLFR